MSKTALVVVDFSIKDADKLASYSTQAAATLIAFNGEFIAKAPIESFHGDAPFSHKVVIQFNSVTDAKNWYHSNAYQKLIDLRNQAMNSQFHLIA